MSQIEILREYAKSKADCIEAHKVPPSLIEYLVQTVGTILVDPDHSHKFWRSVLDKLSLEDTLTAPMTLSDGFYQTFEDQINWSRVTRHCALTKAQQLMFAHKCTGYTAEVEEVYEEEPWGGQ